MRLFGKVDGVRDRLDRPFTFRGLPFTIQRALPVEEEDSDTGGIRRFNIVSEIAPRLALSVFEQPGGAFLHDWTRARGVTIETSEHGFGMLNGFMEANDMEAFRVYQAEKPWHLVVSDGVNTAYEGRVEDIAITQGGFSFSGFGYWRATRDIPFTGMFVETRLSQWTLLNADEVANAMPDRFAADNNNRLYAAPNNGEKFGSSTAWSVWGYTIPSGSEEEIREFSFNYRLVAPSNWRVRVDRRAADWSLLSTIWTKDGNGSQQDGSEVLTFDPCAAVTVSFFYNTTTATYTGDTGNVYMRFTQPKVQSKAGAITARDIAQRIVEYISDSNPTQLNDSVSAIADPGVTLVEESYEDAWPGDILTGLTGLGDNQTPPRRWQTSVWESRLLTFTPEDNYRGRTWYVDIVDFQLERSLDEIRNEMYAVYNGGRERAARTSIASKNSAVSRLGIRRRGAIDVQTVSQAYAEGIRDMALESHGQVNSRAKIVMRGVYDASGLAHPLYLVRAGDVLVIRNLPTDTFSEIDNIRRFRLSGTQYDCDNDILTPIPADKLTTLEMVIARRERGI